MRVAEGAVRAQTHGFPPGWVGRLTARHKVNGPAEPARSGWESMLGPASRRASRERERSQASLPWQSLNFLPLPQGQEA